MKRVEEGGQRYEEVIDLVCNAVEQESQNKHRPQELLEPGLRPWESREYMNSVLRGDAKNYVNAIEFVGSHDYFFLRTPKLLAGATGIPQQSIDLVRSKLLSSLEDLLAAEGAHTTQWNHDTLVSATERAIKVILAEAGSSMKKKEIWKVLRAMLTGGQKGPSLMETMEILGPEVVLDRIKRFESAGYMDPSASLSEPQAARS